MLVVRRSTVEDTLGTDRDWEVVGFIGVGLMGRGMARNLLTKGHPLVVLGHRNREPVEQLKALGAQEAASARELASR